MGILNSLFGRQGSKSVSTTPTTICRPKGRCFTANEQADRLAILENIKDDMIDWLTSLPILNEGDIIVNPQHPDIKVYIGCYSDTMTFKCEEREYRLSLATQVIDQATREFEIHPLFYSNTIVTNLNSPLEDIASDAVMLKRMIEEYRRDYNVKSF